MRTEHVPFTPCSEQSDWGTKERLAYAGAGIRKEQVSFKKLHPHFYFWILDRVDTPIPTLTAKRVEGA